MKFSNSAGVSLLLLVFMLPIFGSVVSSAAENPKPIEIENEYARYIIGPDGTNLHFTDKQARRDYCLNEPASKFAHITKNGTEYYASSVASRDGKIEVQFSNSNITAVIEIISHPDYFSLRVLSISDTSIDKLTFLDIPLTCVGKTTEPFQFCALALNLQTNVVALPGPMNRLEAEAFQRFGFPGAQAAVIACPKGKMLDIMKKVVTDSNQLPQSPLGGPWAKEAENNRGSYNIDREGITLGNVDRWIEVTKSIGATTIDFHGGKSFRFGDCYPNPKLYPNGFADLKAVIDRLHQAGIKAGLHTYSFFMDKQCPWITPVPDPRIAKDAVFTLAESVTDQDTIIPVVESTSEMSTIIGFHVRNSVTLQVDDELITYSSIEKKSPFAFASCLRGAYGTKIATHKKGAKVYHLKELFQRFAPDGDSTLFTEVADKTAQAYNKCGFDMIYLDALDGADVIAGRENAWHYGSKFVFELVKRLEKPAILETSTFYHHLWYARSRLRAWDVPQRGAKRMIDMHCIANEQEYANTLLPLQLGWYAAFTWNGIQPERTFPDDIEYLCCKCLADDCSLSWLQGFDPDSFSKSHNSQRLASIIRNYEQLRLSNYFPESVKEKLRVRGNEFVLEQVSNDANGQWELRPAKYYKHKIEACDPCSNVWVVENEFCQQPLQVRIEALLSAEDYNSPDAIHLTDSNAVNDFTREESQRDVVSIFETVSTKTKGAPLSQCFAATSNYSDTKAAWAMTGKKFNPTLNLTNRGLGVWIYGDNQGQILNFQLKAPLSYSVCAVSEHYVPIDFNGWKYFELIETEDDRALDYRWPYACPEVPIATKGEAYLIYAFSLYFWSIDYGHIESLNLWYNNLPVGKKIKCYIAPIKALPLKNVKIKNPTIAIGDMSITFPVELETGSYIEFRSLTDCTVYDAQGEVIKQLKPLGEVPILQAGKNDLAFASDTAESLRPRARITVISKDKNALGK